MRPLSLQHLCRPEAVVFDLHNTLMFGHDRLGPEQDYASTYRQLDGGRLPSELVDEVVCAVVADRWAWNEPGLLPPMEQVAARVLRRMGLQGEEAARIAEVVALHEVGVLPQASRQLLHTLRRHTRLALVSNIWSDSRLWHDHFDRCGVSQLFEVVVFSSELGCDKPDPRIFLEALDQLDIVASECLFVGDDPVADIDGAGRLGFRTALVGPRPVATHRPDYQRSTLAELLPPEGDRHGGR